MTGSTPLAPPTALKTKLNAFTVAERAILRVTADSTHSLTRLWAVVGVHVGVGEGTEGVGVVVDAHRPPGVAGTMPPMHMIILPHPTHLVTHISLHTISHIISHTISILRTSLLHSMVVHPRQQDTFTGQTVAGHTNHQKTDTGITPKTVANGQCT